MCLEQLRDFYVEGKGKESKEVAITLFTKVVSKITGHRTEEMGVKYKWPWKDLAEILSLSTLKKVIRIKRLV